MSRHWGEYPVIRFSEVPELETHLVDQPNLPSLGIGEASPGPAGAAVANAVANALGGRHLDGVPYTNEKVLQVLAAMGAAATKAQR
jgi:CO/xanthine dehydrogenase Mo-binding subunit